MKDFVRRWIAGPETPAPAAHLPPGQRLYCVGDIHGCCDLLRRLHAMIEADAAGYEGDKWVVYLGDYIDRGPQSREVVDLLLQQPLAGFQPVHLLGNHEQALLDFLQHPLDVVGWLYFGGLATLRSYGITVRPDPAPTELLALRDWLESRLPEPHREFFSRLVLLHRAGNYCFVHAGIRPGVPLEEQRNEDLLWIREDFTESRQDHGCVIVHGHTITPGVEFRDNRIGIDTGAFHSGVLTSLVLEGETRRLLQTGNGR